MRLSAQMIWWLNLRVVTVLNKLYIIQNVDRKLPLTDIADSKGLPMEELIKQMEAIVYSGTKLDVSYWVDEMLDDDQQEEIHEYFLESEDRQN